MLVMSLIGSAVLLALVLAAGCRSSPRFELSALCSFLALVPAFACLLSASLLLNALLLLVVSLVAARWEPKPGRFLAWCLGATAVAYLAVGVPTLWDLYGLLLQAPMQSLEPRLAYETNQREASAPRAGPNNEAASAFLDETKSMRSQFRAAALYRLHEHFEREFADSPGFGVRRHISTRHYVRLPDIESVPLSAGARGGPSANGASYVHSPARPVDSFNDMIHESVIDFAHPETLGYIRDRSHVAGFQPHHFTRMPEVPSDTWQITRLELVSLLKFDTPAVYLSENLPRMDELAAAPTRPLDDFEVRALKAVRGGQELVTDESPERLRLFGAIRAFKACVKCHHGDEGELLGAFTYELHPTR